MNGSAVPAVSGMVSLPMQQPNASYTMTWYSTTTDQPTSTQTLAANSAGTLILNVPNLSTDIAVKIQ